MKVQASNRADRFAMRLADFVMRRPWLMIVATLMLVAPRDASSFAVTRPMPLPAPVTNETRPSTPAM